MKRLAFKEFLSLIIFFLIAIASLFVIRPAYRQISLLLNSGVLSFFDMIEEKTGISVSYSSMSPSIFSGLSLKKIELRDASDGDTILEIKNAVLNYNIFQLLFGDRKKAFKTVTVDGVMFGYDSSENYSLLQKIFPSRVEDEGEAFASDSSQKKNVSQKNPQEGTLALLQDIVSLIPFGVLIKNVHIQFSAEQKVLDVFMRRLDLNLLQTSSRIALGTYGSVLYSDASNGKNYSVDFSADGSIEENVDGSLVNVHFSDFTDGNFRLNTLNLRLGYDNRVVSVRTVQNTYPFLVSGTYDFDSQDVNVAVETKNLVIGELFYVKRMTDAISRLKQMTVNMKASAGYNIASKQMNYLADGIISISNDDPLNVSYSLSGDADELSVKKIAVEGKHINADYSGNFKFEGFKLSGNANLYNYTLKNGGIISTEVYIDPLESGFFCFAPQLVLGEKSFTALELSVMFQQDSIDFTFSLSDYDHLDSEEPGVVRMDGSFITDTKYLQASLTSSMMYLDSVAETVAFFTENKKSNFAFLEPFVFNTELYFSSDLNTFSYNVPYIVIANTQKENQAVYLSLDGNENSIQITQGNAIFGKNMLQLSAAFERLEDSDESFFSADLNYDSIPYHFNGTLLPGTVNISGDYGAEFYFHKSGSSRYDGSFSLQGFPLPVGKAVLSFSADSGFSYTKSDGFVLSASRIIVEEVGGRYNFSPHLEFSASVSKYGAFLNKIAYTDRFSSLEGKSELLWNINDGIFDSANFSFNAESLKSLGESINISLDVSNPNGDALSVDFIKHSMYLNAQVVFEKFLLDRFTSDNNNKNEVSATLIASGTLDNPFIGLNVSDLSFMTGGNLLEGVLSAYFEERVLSIENTELKYNKMTFSDIKLHFDLDSFSGLASAIFDAEVVRHTIHAPLNLEVSDSVMGESGIVPEEFRVRFFSPEISGDFFKEKFPVEINALRSKDFTTFYTSENFGVSGMFSDSGELNAHILAGKDAMLSASGTFGRTLDIYIDDVHINGGKILSYLNLDVVRFYRGLITGNVHIGGMNRDPDFTGLLTVSDLDITLPTAIPYHITAPKIDVVMNHTEMNIAEIQARVKNNAPVNVGANFYFDRWMLERIDIRAYTPPNVFAPVDIITGYIEIAGDAAADLNMTFDFDYFEIDGSVSGKNIIAKTSTRMIASPQGVQSKYYVRTDLDIKLLQHCTFRLDPLLRAVLSPDSSFLFKFDSGDSVMQLDGEITIRTGDIAYLNRNFYLKSGSLRFSPNESTFNPIITATAETREKDEDGNDVRLILSATNQYLFDFYPQISSIPAKSEAELNRILGNLAAGDAKNIGGFLLSAGDYALQSTVGRFIENKLRDLLKFDILSIRTSVLQNALKQSLLLNSADSDKNKNRIGNYLDNSTVYIGKYIGNTLYADALLHWSYDETRVDNNSSVWGGLVFKPEIGLELESPFANIRWNMAPDITALKNNKIVGSTSVTLSWKFSF